MKAFDSWQKSNAIDEVEKRKQLHVASLQGIVEWQRPEDQNEAIESVEEFYEQLKDMVWDSRKMQAENDEMKELEDSDPFLRAGRKNLEKVIQPAMEAPELPGEDSIMKSLIG